MRRSRVRKAQICDVLLFREPRPVPDRIGRNGDMLPGYAGLAHAVAHPWAPGCPVRVASRRRAGDPRRRAGSPGSSLAARGADRRLARPAASGRRWPPGAPAHGGGHPGPTTRLDRDQSEWPAAPAQGPQVPAGPIGSHAL